MNNPRNQFSDSTTNIGSGVTFNEGLRQYMLGVYNYMGLGIAATAMIAFAFVNYFQQDIQALYTWYSNPLAQWGPAIAVIAMGFFGPRVIFSASKPVAHAIYWGYVALWGLIVGPTVTIYMINPASGAVDFAMASLVYEAFFITAALFGAVSLWGYTTKKDLSGWGQFLMMATIGLIIAVVANVLIFKSGMLGLIISAISVVTFSAVTAWETQTIKRLYAEGHEESNSRASILGAFMLYGSFVVLFLNILRLLSALRGD